MLVFKVAVKNCIRNRRWAQRQRGSLLPAAPCENKVKVRESLIDAQLHPRDPPPPFAPPPALRAQRQAAARVSLPSAEAPPAARRGNLSCVIELIVLMCVYGEEEKKSDLR